MTTDAKFLSEQYRLKLDPFDKKIGLKAELGAWTNREAQVRSWNRTIAKSVNSQSNHMAFVVGNYGRGKSLSLFKIIDEAQKRENVFPTYLNLKGEEVSKPGIDFLLRILSSLDLNNLAKDKGKLKSAFDNWPEVFEEPKSVLKKIMIDNSKLARYFLTGQIRASRAQLDELEVLRKIETVDVAKEYLAAVLLLLRRLDFKTLLLAVDEFEYLFSLVAKSRRSVYIALLRSLFDLPVWIERTRLAEETANMLFFFSISESGWTSLKEMSSKEEAVGGPTVPLLDRVEPETVLGRFDVSGTKQLIERRLSFNRVKGKFEEAPLIPFDEDFVKYVQNRSKGEPRDIIDICEIVLAEGLAQKVPRIDSKFVASLERLGVLVPSAA